MRVAEYIRKQIPAARIIVWNDMMNELMMHEKIVEKYVRRFFSTLIRFYFYYPFKY